MARNFALSSSTIAGTSHISDVEIFRVGKWNDESYVAADLDAMVEAFPHQGFQPPVKLGHVSDQDAPAYGWISSIRRQGDRLIASLANVPNEIVEMIRRRQYDTVSAEIYFDTRRNGRLFRRALKAVALLGANIPAVSSLRPLHQSLAANPGGFARVATYSVGGSSVSAPARTFVEPPGGFRSFAHASNEVARLTDLYLAENGMQKGLRTYQAAMHAVLAANPALKAAYAGL